MDRNEILSWAYVRTTRSESASTAPSNPTSPPPNECNSLAAVRVARSRRRLRIETERGGGGGFTSRTWRGDGDVDGDGERPRVTYLIICVQIKPRSFIIDLARPHDTFIVRS